MEHAKGTQGDFGMNQKGTGVYGMDASGDGIVTADELKTHYDALAVADAKHKAATEANDAAAIVNDVIAVSENNNLVLPSEFGLLTKQAIYLNRYVTTLAPDLDPFAEDVLGGPI